MRGATCNKVRNEGQVLLAESPEPISDFASDPILKLMVAHSVKDVAHVLGMDPERFFYVVQRAQDGSYYKTFTIPKKKGGVRVISAPKKGLGIAQTRLATILNKHYRPKPFVQGYVKKQSFLTNAKLHERQKWVLNLDIKDFYPSITFPRVRGLFMSKLFGFNDRVATILARITTTKDGLPQGARTSPTIANLIAYTLDRNLVALATRHRLTYSRYADDITFSSSRREVPADLVRGWEPQFGNRELDLGSDLLNSFKDSGFAINTAKTRIAFSYERQEVTGLVVNRSANVWRKDISRMRMVLHSARAHGAEKAAQVWIGKEGTADKFWLFVSGWLSYFAQVRGKDDPVVTKLCKLAIISGLKGIEWIEKGADMVREFDVFLSHASEDKARARRLKDKLESVGVRVFFDETSITWGDSIVEKINHGLLKSSFFMPFLSENFTSKGWTNKELNSAIAMNANRKGRILPIKDEGFSVEDNYPLLNETLYQVWPKVGEDEFLGKIADAILLKIQFDHESHPDLG